jgi:hypothetical protein
MWIESHADLGEHPKLAELCFNLAIKKHEAIGYLHLLWHFTLKYAWRDGDLRRFTARVICEAVGWDKDHDTFINTLMRCGWIDESTMMVHDWLDYAGKLVKDRLYNEKRRNTPLNDVLRRKSAATIPNHTIPNRKTTTSSSTDVDGFEEFWKAYPKKVGKGAAVKAWKRAIGSGGIELSAVLNAIASQKRCEQWQRDGGQFIPHPATWLNQSRWLDEMPIANHSAHLNGFVENFAEKLAQKKQELDMIREKEYTRRKITNG